MQLATRPRSGARILLLGGDADYNTGDRAILSALVRCIDSQDKSVEIAVVGGPSLGQEIPGIDRVIPRGPSGIADLGRYASRADRILIAGGGLFQDDDSRAKMPYWAARISLVRIFNSRIIGHSIGVGPLQHAESRVAARLACSALSSISVRDRFAREELAACTSRAIDLVPDPAFMLEPAPPQVAADFLHSLELRPNRPIIAVAARQWFHERGGFVPNMLKAKAGIQLRRDHSRNESLLDTIAGVLTPLARRLDASVLLLPSYIVAHEADDVACGSLAHRLERLDVRIARITDPHLYKAVLGHASLLISSRMHPLILAAAMGTPFVGLSFNKKFDGVFDLLNMHTQLLPLDDFPSRWGPRELLAEAETALEGRNDLRKKAEQLGDIVRQQTLAVAFGDA